MKGKRRQVVIVAGLVGLGLVVGLAGLLLVVLPQKSQADRLDAQIASLQTKLVSLHAGPRRGPAIKAADLFSLSRAMPDTADMPGIVLDLAHASSRSGADLLTITPGAPIVQTDGAQALPITVVVGGSWTQVAAFLRALRLDVQVKGQRLKVGGRLFVADSVQLTGASGKQEVQASLVLNAFTYGVAPVVTASTDTTSTTTTSAPSGSVQAAGASGSAG